MCKGYMKLSRDLRRWGWYRDSHMVHLLIHLMLEANYQDSYYMGVLIKRGQLATGRKQLSAETGMSEREIRTCLERLSNDQQIIIQPTNKFSIITICNYESWQDNDITKRPTNDQQNIMCIDQLNDQPNDHIKINKEIKEKKEELVITSKKNEVVDSSWRSDYNVYRSLFEKAKVEVLNDVEFRNKQLSYYPGLDFEKTLEKCLDYWLDEERGWHQCKKNRSSKTINPVKRIKDNFDKNRIYKSRYEESNQQQPDLFSQPTEQFHSNTPVPKQESEKFSAFGRSFDTQKEADKFYDEQESIRDEGKRLARRQLGQVERFFRDVAPLGAGEEQELLDEVRHPSVFVFDVGQPLVFADLPF